MIVDLKSFTTLDSPSPPFFLPFGTKLGKQLGILKNNLNWLKAIWKFTIDFAHVSLFVRLSFEQLP